MKKLFTFLAAALFTVAGFGQVNPDSIWAEDFESYADESSNPINEINDGLLYYPPSPPTFTPGYYSNVNETYYPLKTETKWDVEFGFLVVKPEFTFSIQDVSGNNVFQIDNVEKSTPSGFATWSSDLIDVSGNNFNISIEVAWDNSTTYDVSDYILIELYVDGSLVGTLGENGTYFNSSLNSSEIFLSDNFLSGNGLRVVVSSVNNTGGAITFDNIEVNKYTPENNTIYEIQYTTDPAESGTYPSPMVDEIVTIKAAVTAVRDGFGYYLQETDGNGFTTTPPFGATTIADWHGIYVNDASLNATIKIGDVVEVTGTVKENAGVTVITLVTSSTITTDDPIFYLQDLIFEELNEGNESVLNSIRFFRVIDPSNSGDIIQFIAGIGESGTAGVYSYLVPIDNNLLDDFPIYNRTDRLYEQIIGVTNYNSSGFNLSPRDYLSDFNWAYVPVAVDNNSVDANRITAISSTIVLETASASNASIYNLSGQLVKEVNVTSGRTEIEMNAGVYIVKMNVGNDVITEKVLVK